MTPIDQDWPARLLAVATRMLPAGRRDWGRAMQAELAAVTERPDRWSFTWGCLRAASAQFHLLRGAVHLLAVLGTLATLLAWTAGAGVGVLVFATIATSFLIGLSTVSAERSAATRRVLITGAGSGLGAAMIWLVIVLLAPPIPAWAGWALALTGVAAVTAVIANSGRSSTTQGCLLAGLLATATTMALIFVGVVALARWGPDSLIPHITPHALPADRIAESRIEIVDPYVLILVLSGLAATALSLAAVLTRRPVAGTPSYAEHVEQEQGRRPVRR